MKLIILVSLTIVSLSITPLVYCQWSDEENVRNGIRFTIKAERDSYKVGESIVMYLEFQNISDKEINFYFSKCPVEFLHLHIYDFKVGEIFKTKAKHESPCYPSDAKLLRLKPGEAYRDTDTINTLLWGSTELIPLVPGRYQIGYRYSIPEEWLDLGADFWQKKVMSNKITLNFE